ncbi:MAG: hypothetical protein RID11_01985 [Roseovarius sp.]|jgi:uncharacterized protein YceK|uniref:hypothetical protein n=1 Tax=Roseovarius sp. TaxID=1486281 RepID=UPI0032EB1470
MIRGLAGCHVVQRRLAVAILLAASSAGPVLAQTADPAKTAFGVEMDLTGVDLDIRNNDVPLFGVVEPANPFDARGVHFLHFNAALLPGLNEISVRYSEIPEPMMDGMWVKLRLSYREAGTFPDPFSSDDYAIDIPPAASPDGRVLARGMSTQIAVEAAMRRAHDAFAEGRGSVVAELGPKLERMAACLDMPREAMLDTTYVPFLDPSYGFALHPYDADEARIVLIGNGRFATLVPPPVTFRNPETGEVLAPDLAFFPDEA